jgi:hypothetical protein
LFHSSSLLICKPQYPKELLPSSIGASSSFERAVNNVVLYFLILDTTSSMDGLFEISGDYYLFLGSSREEERFAKRASMH